MSTDESIFVGGETGCRAMLNSLHYQNVLVVGNLVHVASAQPLDGLETKVSHREGHLSHNWVPATLWRSRLGKRHCWRRMCRDTVLREIGPCPHSPTERTTGHPALESLDPLPAALPSADHICTLPCDKCRPRISQLFRLLQVFPVNYWILRTVLQTPEIVVNRLGGWENLQYFSNSAVTFFSVVQPYNANCRSCIIRAPQTFAFI